MLMAVVHGICTILSPAIPSILSSTFGSVNKMVLGKECPQNGCWGDALHHATKLHPNEKYGWIAELSEWEVNQEQNDKIVG